MLVLQNWELPKEIFEISLFIKTPIFQEFRILRNRGLQHLDIINNINMDSKTLERTNIPMETIPSQEIKTTLPKIISQIIFIREPEFFL